MGYITLLLKYVNTAQLMWAVNKLVFSSTISVAKTHSSQNYGYELLNYGIFAHFNNRVT